MKRQESSHAIPDQKPIHLQTGSRCSCLGNTAKTRQIQHKPLSSVPSQGISICSLVLPVPEAASTAMCLVALMSLPSINVPNCFSVHLIHLAFATFCGRRLHNSILCSFWLVLDVWEGGEQCSCCIYVWLYTVRNVFSAFRAEMWEGEYT